jgi:hypothetical protein
MRSLGVLGLVIVLASCAASGSGGGTDGDDGGGGTPNGGDDSGSGSGDDAGYTYDSGGGNTGQDSGGGGGPGCDLADPTSCGALACGYNPNTQKTFCAKAGTGTQGSACSAQNPDCAPAYTCVAPANVCVHWCKLPSGTACPNSTTCKNTLQNPPVVNGTKYGICQ